MERQRIDSVVSNKFNVSDLNKRFFPYFSRAYNMVRVIVGKYSIEIRHLKAGSVRLTKITSS